MRSTLLHEMCHVASGRGSGHDSRFFRELERLLRHRAPVGVGAAENQGRPFLAAVPARFRLVRRAMRPHYEREQRRLALLAAGVEEQNLVDYAEERFEQAAQAGVSWQHALLAIGDKVGILDADGKVFPEWRDKMARMRRAYRRACAIHRMLQAARDRARLGSEPRKPPKAEMPR